MVLQTQISVVKHPFPINGEPLAADREIIKNDLFAVVEFSGTQYKVTKVSQTILSLSTTNFKMTLWSQNDTIVVDKIPDIDIDDVINMGKV